MNNDTFTSGYWGVNWDEDEEIYKVYILVNGGLKHLGNFDNYDEAVAARQEANIRFGYHKNYGKKHSQ